MMLMCLLGHYQPIWDKLHVIPRREALSLALLCDLLCISQERPGSSSFLRASSTEASHNNFFLFLLLHEIVSPECSLDITGEKEKKKKTNEAEQNWSTWRHLNYPSPSVSFYYCNICGPVSWHQSVSETSTTRIGEALTPLPAGQIWENER